MIFDMSELTSLCYKGSDKKWNVCQVAIMSCAVLLRRDAASHQDEHFCVHNAECNQILR